MAKNKYEIASEILDRISPEEYAAVELLVAAKSCCPMTGRYYEVNKKFEEAGSEFALMRNRVQMELVYLYWIYPIIQKDVTTTECNHLYDFSNTVVSDFSYKDYLAIKSHEATTRHDVKAVEYYLRDKLTEAGMEKYIPYVHIGCTSEDTNNIAYATMMLECMKIWWKSAANITNKMRNIAYQNRKYAMLGHTHGQPATPLVLGHALAVGWNRLRRSLDTLKALPINGKLNGAVGNMAAMRVAYPEHDWMELAGEYVDMFNFEYNPLTSQIEDHDYIVRILNEIGLFTMIVEDIDKNQLWPYISRDYLKQITKAGEVGSSTMPHKTNPINAENSWGNAHMTMSDVWGLVTKLPFSIMQRDLSDSSVMRNLAMVFLHSYQAISELNKMLDRIEANEKVLVEDLYNNPQVLAEPIQTVLRKNGYADAYEIMKDMTKGKQVTLAELRNFISTLNINEDDKKRLMELEPKTYIGYSVELVEKYCKPTKQGISPVYTI